MKQINAVMLGLILIAAMVRGEDQPAEFNPAELDAIIKDWEAEKTPTTEKANVVIAALTELGGAAVPAMIARLETAATEKPQTAGLLLTTLVRLRTDRATDLLVKLALSGSNSSIKRNAMGALKAIGGATAMPALIAGLDAELPEEFAAKDKYRERDDWYKLQDDLINTIQAMCKSGYHCSTAAQAIMSKRFAATPAACTRYARALAGVRLSIAEDALLAMAFDASVEVQAAAIHALGVGGSTRVAKPLIAQLSNADANVKTSACFALGSAKFLTAVPHLIKLLKSEEGDVSKTALWALRNITGKQFQEATRWSAWYEEESARSQQMLAEILTQIKTGPAELTPLAVEQVGELILSRDKLVDELRFLLDHKDFRVRAALCSVLAQCNDPRAQQLLLLKMEDGSEVVSYAAWRGLKYATGEKLPLNSLIWAEFLAKKG